MTLLQKLFATYGSTNCRDLGSRQLEALRDGLKQVSADEIKSSADGNCYIALLRKFREAVAENDKLHGENYPQLLNSLLSVGEDGLYSNSLRFIFELIQNVDDCEYLNADDCKLDMYFDFNSGEIVLTYNEVGFTPFNVFAITGIAEAAKNVSASKNEIGEKGIGFKSVFGVASRVLIRSGWFSFELYKENFTIPVAAYQDDQYCAGTQMTLYVPGRAKEIYQQIRDQYCRKEALFSKNPLLFLNKLTSLKLYYDSWRSMEFHVSRSSIPDTERFYREDGVTISVCLRDHENGRDRENIEEITCTRYSCSVVYSQEACQSRYGDKTLVGSQGGKRMLLQAVIPHAEFIKKVGHGGLYSFLPTQLSFTVPIVCHAPFKLDASREFVDPQDQGRLEGNLWFKETVRNLSKLMDHVYADWARIARQDIVQYLPSIHGSIFAENNGKELCLSRIEKFTGIHFLMLPLFETVDGTFKKASEVFCFDPNEKISEPVKAAELLGVTESLFLVPENTVVGKLGISVEKDVCNRLFSRALHVSSVTSDILAYLDSVNYEYSAKQFPTDETLTFSVDQVRCIMKHKHLADMMDQIAVEAIRSNSRPKFSIVETQLITIDAVFSNDFVLSETPKCVEKYMQYCKSACICIDIPADRFLPCFNGIVLSQSNALSSFASFCYAMDTRDTFATRIKLREASKLLDQCIENNSGSASDYIRKLCNIRLTVKDSLGSAGYKSYLELILKSGTDRTRFIQELLQNADDCTYSQEQVPTFMLSQNGNTIITEYNEVGFSRENIRSITAIGESTKNQLLNQNLNSIGEKGVGFKTIFAVASRVRIYSGEYSFSLTDKEPTIPRLLESKKLTNGTRMEITLKDRTSMASLKPADILRLCMCLRQLKELNMNGHVVTIADTDFRRTITIDGRLWSFSKYVHSFVIANKKAMEERENGARKISRRQQIVCYVPEKNSVAGYPLYVGLPTKHQIKIPMIIDAPFELTTSREYIEEGCRCWNDIVKSEMYNAIIEVIHARKAIDGMRVLRFSKFLHMSKDYTNELSDSEYLNAYDYLTRLRSEKILPTFAKNTFVAASEGTAYRYPQVAIILLSRLSPSEYGAPPETIIRPILEGELKERIDASLKALACEEVPFGTVFSLLEKYVESFMDDETFGKKLYEYLQRAPADFQEKLRRLKIIPVFGMNGGIQYISWIDDGIFTKEGAEHSKKSYWVLNEKLLLKTTCETILNVKINEMNFFYEMSRYQNALKENVKGSDINKVYAELITEYANGNLEKYDCSYILSAPKVRIPLKNELGEIKNIEMYLCSQPSGYFAVEMLQDITVNKECEGLAKFIGCKDLRDIYYEDMNYHAQLTADDVEALQDDYFVHSEEILRGFYRAGHLSDELMEEYNLSYIGMGHANDSYYEYDFPEDPVRDEAQMKRHIASARKNLVTIFSEEDVRIVQKCRRSNGNVFALNGKEAREATLRIYTPEGANNISFCQMCCELKDWQFMEVNNLELKPRYYFPQTRVALCLECSKRFEALRSNENIRKKYLEAICNASTSECGKVEISIGSEETLTFTAKHLAEVQELLKNMPKS